MSAKIYLRFHWLLVWKILYVIIVVKIYGATKKTIEVLPILNHEEADTRLVFHEEMSNEAAVIVAKDKDVFLLLIYALSQLECFLPQWYMKVDLSQFINIKMIYNNLGSEISDIVPKLQS